MQSTHEFLETLFSNLTSTQYIETRAWPGANGATDVSVEFCSSVVIAERSIQRAVKSHQNVFVGVAPRNERSGKAESVHALPYIWCDVDNCDAPPRFVLPPTMLVKSGHGWHLYWHLTEPTSIESGTRAMQSIATALGGDAVWDAPRVLRVPGTQNFKSDPPTNCTLVELHPTAIYPLDQLSRAATAKVSKRTLRDIYEDDHGDFHSRSERDWAVMRDCIKIGLSKDSIQTLFSVAPCGDKVRAEGEHYFTQTYERAFKALNAGQDTAPGDEKFVVVNDELYTRTPKGELYRVATFWLEPIALIESTEHGQDSLSAILHTADGIWPLTITKKAFNNATTLNASMPQASAVWLGSEKQSREYLAFVIAQMRAKGIKTVHTTSVLGRHGSVWIGSEQTLTTDAVLTGADRATYYLSAGRDHISTRYTFQPHTQLVDLLDQMFPAVFDINYREMLWPVLGWFFAAPYKPTLLEMHQIRFPHLNIFGTRGSGKTSLIHLMLRMAGLADVRSFDANTTPFVLLSLLGASNAVPVSLTEFRAETLVRLNRYLLTAYDSGRDARGRPDQTTQEYPMTAPLVLDGEDAINDPATKERSILARMSPETILPDTDFEKAFRRIAALPVEHIAGPYIQYTLCTTPKWAEAHALTRAAYARSVVPDRVLNNLAVTVLGQLHLTDWLAQNGVVLASIIKDTVYADTHDAAYNVIEESGRTTLLADEFIEAVVNQCALSTERVPFLAGYDPIPNTLRINLSSAYAWWVTDRNRQKRSYLSKDAILGQLVERKITSQPPATGQYVTDIANLTISLSAAQASGLDIPAKIGSDRIFILDYEDDK